MVEVYVRLIQLGRKTIDNVPKIIRDQVVEKLKESEVDDNE